MEATEIRWEQRWNGRSHTGKVKATEIRWKQRWNGRSHKGKVKATRKRRWKQQEKQCKELRKEMEATGKTIREAKEK